MTTDTALMGIDQTSPLLGLDDYAARHEISARTARRYLDAGLIPGARKVHGRWAIPADAVRQTPTTSAVAATRPAAAPAALTVGTVLATLPVFLPLETASHLLGVSVYAMKADPDYFHLVRKGERGAYVMPKFRIRELNGD
jgi:hypothetical protein